MRDSVVLRPLRSIITLAKYVRTVRAWWQPLVLRRTNLCDGVQWSELWRQLGLPDKALPASGIAGQDRAVPIHAARVSDGGGIASNVE